MRATGLHGLAKAIVGALLVGAAGTCHALVSIPYTREALPVQCVLGNCFYVDGVNGSDANDGTSLQSAWRTLRKAHDAIPGGATVLVADGVYTDVEGSGNVVFVTKSGSAASWTTFAALPGHRPVLLVPKGAWVGFHVATAHHVLIDGFEIVGRAQSMTKSDAPSPPTPVEGCMVIGGGGVPQPYDVIVRNSILHDCPGGGLMHFAADSVYILDNHIYNNGWYTWNGIAGINLIHQADSGHATDIAGYRAYVVGNLIERNWNYFPWEGTPGVICDGDGIIVDANKHTQPGVGPGDIQGVPYTGRTYIANNIVRESGAQGIASYISARVDIVNNTVYNNLQTETCGIQGEVTSWDSTDVNIVNNVVINLSGKGAVSTNGAALDHNVWTGKISPPTTPGQHDVNGDAHLANPAQGDFTPVHPSPAIGNGAAALAPAVDFFGKPRSASRIDRGAIQVSGPGMGDAVLAANPYGSMSVQGASFNGVAITSLQPKTVVQLGPVAGAPGSYAQIDVTRLDVSVGDEVQVVSGAPGQKLVLVATGGTASRIAGALRAVGGAGAPAPELYLHNPNGIAVDAGGSVTSASAVTLDALAASPHMGEPIVNAGVVDGGNHLRLLGGRVTGGGPYKGNAITVSTFGNANNPVHGAYFLRNGIGLYPSAGTDVALAVNGYGASPQVFNIKVHGDASVSMPSAWPPGSTLPRNNAVVALGGSRPAGVPEPAYGGGSAIVQATGALTLAGGPTNDLVFPGAIVLIAGGTLDLNGVVINQGWTITGKQFQGIFFESPNIVSPAGAISVLTNNPNWINFSTLPHQSVRTWSLAPDPSGGASYIVADSFAPHLNVYSASIEAAANGQCWVCLINPTPVDMR